MHKRIGLLGALAVATSALISGCDEPCPSDNCCGDDCCEGDDCVTPVSHGVATPWEGFGGELGAAPSGTLLLKMTSGEGFCADPWVSELACGETVAWEVDVPLPPALQFVGSVVNLADLADLGGATVRQTVGKGGGCDIDEQVLEGKLEVVAINEQNVTVRFSETSPAIAELEEEQSVPRCQNPELPQQAVAMSESQLTAVYPTQISGGAEDAAPREPPVTEPLHIFIDVSDPAAGAQCSDPRALSAGCDPARSTIEITMGIDQQFPGSYPLGEFVTVETRSNELLENDSCNAAVDAWTSGTVDIVAITPTLVHVRVDDGIAVVDAIATRCN